MGSRTHFVRVRSASWPRSGTGAQEVTCLLDADGVGVTAVLGVGGRDLSAAVGGRSTLAAMKALDEHAATEFIVVLSKPPDPKVAERVRAAAGRLNTPSLVAFVGMGQGDLTNATAQILAALGRSPTPPPMWPAPYERTSRPGFIRGLFSGGTLCDEAMAIAAESLRPIVSNTPSPGGMGSRGRLASTGPSHDRLRRRPADRGKATSDDRPVTAT